MDDFIQVKESQVHHYRNIPLYCKADNGDYVLYKPKGKYINFTQDKRNLPPQFFIQKQDSQTAVSELQKSFNTHLKQCLNSKGLTKVKSILCDVVTEAMSRPSEGSLKELPETIDIMFEGYGHNAQLLKKLTETSSTDRSTMDHVINTMAMAMLYCSHCNLSKEETRKLSLAALLHDIGKTKLDANIVITNRKLTDNEFEEYKTHAAIGHDLIKEAGTFDASIAQAILEHHERLDGNGYPRGIAHICFEAQLIGLIDSYEYLTHRSKVHRKIKSPFDTLNLIKHEVIIEGKFNRTIFKELCTCLA
ncbi:HD domain-containing phosphohydrolase [Desulfoluna sp.]|uniref:HD-GYP domain-containing protein n=1 Tax=Desulfoluna sp. TaxID=2045199 RepID=UPI00261267E9|nr:HD domain-containing phosphohydrolase [Desulfoluna sp.]